MSLSYHDAMSQEDRDKWEEACTAELETFRKLGVFEEVPRPQDRKIVGSKWVFRMKHSSDGQIEKYKAQVVAQGFSQGGLYTPPHSYRNLGIRSESYRSHIGICYK